MSSKEKLYDVIKGPVITEKSMTATSLNQYTFDVRVDATKVEIKQAVELLFPGRTVKSVRTVYTPSKAKRVGYTFGRSQSGKKAIVKIEGEPLNEIIGV
jgi:large subunit ribosomal protein L23